MSAALVTAEVGKPIREALADMDKCTWNCGVVADSAAGSFADHELSSSAARPWLQSCIAAKRWIVVDEVPRVRCAGCRTDRGPAGR